jgi:hypothetical protein
MPSRVRFSTFPRTEPPRPFVAAVVRTFDEHIGSVGTTTLAKGLTSDQLLAHLSEDLRRLGFSLEIDKTRAGKLRRPVFFGENGLPARQYEIDGYHPAWRCGIEIEAGRAWMGNAIYRDLVQAMVMVDLDHLILAVPQLYRYRASGRSVGSKDYENTVSVADALFGHTRIRMPYGLTIIGY